MILCSFLLYKWKILIRNIILGGRLTPAADWSASPRFSCDSRPKRFGSPARGPHARPSCRTWSLRSLGFLGFRWARSSQRWRDTCCRHPLVCFCSTASQRQRKWGSAKVTNRVLAWSCGRRQWWAQSRGLASKFSEWKCIYLVGDEGDELLAKEKTNRGFFQEIFLDELTKHQFLFLDQTL